MVLSDFYLRANFGFVNLHIIQNARFRFEEMGKLRGSDIIFPKFSIFNFKHIQSIKIRWKHAKMEF